MENCTQHLKIQILYKHTLAIFKYLLLYPSTDTFIYIISSNDNTLWSRHLGWKSFICPSRLTLSPSLSCSVSCEANLYGLHSLLLSLWLLKARLEIVGWRRVASVYLFSPPPPCGFAKDGCIYLPLPSLLPGSTLETAVSPSSSIYSPPVAFHGVMALLFLVLGCCAISCGSS